MKKSLLLSLLFIFLSSFLLAQTGDEKRDHVWLLGYSHGVVPPPSMFGNIHLDFNQSPFELTETGGYMSFQETNSSICDREGNLLFYTNGIYIGKGLGEPMANGTGLSPGPWTDEWAITGMLMPGGALILPVPGHDSLYMVFYNKLDVLYDSLPNVVTTHLYYALVDMNQLNGQGAVVEKNVEIIVDTLTTGNISAVRHGNGRDWWVLIPKSDSDIYYRMLLTPEGLQPVESQKIGEVVRDGLGQNVFSPDGTKYARNELVSISRPDTLAIFDFDRCNGLLSNQRRLIYGKDTTITSGGGIAFSPNSRYMYACYFRHLYQFDTWAPDILASMDTVAIWDEDHGSFGTLFYLASLAPDDKIYINSAAGTEYLHVIHQPDLKGDSCGVEQFGVHLPVYNSLSLPKYPNFRLGKWEGSPCDTIQAVGTTGAFSFSKIFVYPNPASEYVVFDNSHTTEKITRVLFYNNMGEIVFGEKWGGHLREYKMDVSGLAAGIYFYTIFGKERILKSGKIIIQHD